MAFAKWFANFTRIRKITAKIMKSFSLIALSLLLVGCRTTEKNIQPRARWTPEQAASWYEKQPWLVGCNFAPSTAINELEMFQADTWDPKTIDRELGWAEDIGFTSIRVYLHDLLWKQDAKGFLNRLDEFVAIADKHKIGVMFVLFDSVWDPNPKVGKQREPRPHIHNSGWVQSPGAEILGNPARHDELKSYVQGVVGHFRNDPRVQLWDIFNEPDNLVSQYKNVIKDKPAMALLLMKKAFAWAREMNPIQPLTSAPWIGTWDDTEKMSAMEKAQIEESDVITFHNYSNLDSMKKAVASLRRYHRPLICSEYMARGNDSHFDPIMGYLKEQNIGAYNWGFVSGKTQTIYPWDSWKKNYTAEPEVWFHDIFRADGTPFDPNEIRYIKSLTRDARKKRHAQSGLKMPVRKARVLALSE
jgi:hypothetical protein